MLSHYTWIYIMHTSNVITQQIKVKINWESMLNKRNLRKIILKSFAFRTKILEA